jgi:hypothetical protein
MAIGMVGDQVSSFCNRSSYLRTYGDEASDQKESSFHFMSRKNSEQVFSVYVIRTIIERECQLVRLGAACQRPPVKLRSRCIAVVREPRRCSDGGGGC